MSRQTRRAFLKRAAASAGVATTFAIAGTSASGRVLGANDRVRIAESDPQLRKRYEKHPVYQGLT